MNSWLSNVQGLASTEDVGLPEALASAHARFEQVHPFLDGNGRTGRLVLNLLLVRLGYPPAIIYEGDRDRYLAALRRADQGDLGSLGEFLARAILDNLYKFVVPAVAGPARLVPLPALATAEISANALRLVAIRGGLKAAMASDGAWRGSRVWVDEYVAARPPACKSPHRTHADLRLLTPRNEGSPVRVRASALEKSLQIRWPLALARAVASRVWTRR